MSKYNNLIDKMNPFSKIILLILITLIGSFDFKPFASSILIISAFIITKFFSTITLKEIINSIKGFLIMSLGFMIIILLSRYISKKPLDIIVVIGLGFRIILISIYSAIFVKTTDPTEFVLVLIKYFKMPNKVGYAFLTAYRFLPTFKDELEIIKHAHQIRGISESKNPLTRVWDTKRYIVPMMANAVRKGIRISMAMETRAFGKYKDRTFYRKIKLTKQDISALIIYAMYIILIVCILYFANLTSFGFTYIQ